MTLNDETKARAYALGWDSDYTGQDDPWSQCRNAKWGELSYQFQIGLDAAERDARVERRHNRTLWRL